MEDGIRTICQNRGNDLDLYTLVAPLPFHSYFPSPHWAKFATTP